LSNSCVNVSKFRLWGVEAMLPDEFTKVAAEVRVKSIN